MTALSYRPADAEVAGIVAAGYDAIADRYDAWGAADSTGPRHRYRQLLGAGVAAVRAAGFVIEHAAPETSHEDNRPVLFRWVVARRPVG